MGRQTPKFKLLPLNSHLDQFQDWVSLARSAGYRPGELARLCSVSLRQLERHFEQRFGSRPQVWLSDQRLERARELLLQGHYVKTVALEMGFKDAAHFCRRFKLRYGLSPLSFVARQTRRMSRSDNKCRV